MLKKSKTKTFFITLLKDLVQKGNRCLGKRENANIKHR